MRYTRADCLDALEAAIDELGHVPTKDEYNTTEGGPHASTISTRLGGWQNALDELGVKREPRYEYTKQGCIEALQEAAEELGGANATLLRDARYESAVSTIQDRFGSWKAAKAEAGVIAWSVRRQA